jgi:hypothetical protein
MIADDPAAKAQTYLRQLCADIPGGNGLVRRDHRRPALSHPDPRV